jgi:hypothetical protein
MKLQIQPTHLKIKIITFFILYNSLITLVLPKKPLHKNPAVTRENLEPYNRSIDRLAAAKQETW